MKEIRKNAELLRKRNIKGSTEKLPHLEWT